MKKREGSFKRRLFDGNDDTPMVYPDRTEEMRQMWAENVAEKRRNQGIEESEFDESRGDPRLNTHSSSRRTTNLSFFPPRLGWGQRYDLRTLGERRAAPESAVKSGHAPLYPNRPPSSSSRRINSMRGRGGKVQIPDMNAAEIKTSDIFVPPVTPDSFATIPVTPPASIINPPTPINLTNIRPPPPFDASLACCNSCNKHVLLR